MISVQLEPVIFGNGTLILRYWFQLEVVTCANLTGCYFVVLVLSPSHVRKCDGMLILWCWFQFEPVTFTNVPR
jgi:hypothetical protein